MVQRGIREYFRGTNTTNVLCDPTNQLNFIPAMNTEFQYLLGLEEVVQFRLKIDKMTFALQKPKIRGRQKKTPKAGAPPTRPPIDPVTCAKCQTDFSCLWRQDKNSSVLCKTCFNYNWKKERQSGSREKTTFDMSDEFSSDVQTLSKHKDASLPPDPQNSYSTTSEMSSPKPFPSPLSEDFDLSSCCSCNCCRSSLRSSCSSHCCLSSASSGSSFVDDSSPLQLLSSSDCFPPSLSSSPLSY